MKSEKAAVRWRRVKMCLLLAVLCGVLLMGFLWYDGIFLAPWHSQISFCDLDGDGQTEKFILERRCLTVLRDEREIWTTEPQWKAEDFLLGDINRDGRKELLVLVWKRGSYGSAKPFWAEKEEVGYSQHIFLYQWKDDRIQPLWMSSRLRPEIREWALFPDGRLSVMTPQGEKMLWGWKTWGLERLDGEKKPF